MFRPSLCYLLCTCFVGQRYLALRVFHILLGCRSSVTVTISFVGPLVLKSVCVLMLGHVFRFSVCLCCEVSDTQFL